MGTKPQGTDRLSATSINAWLTRARKGKKVPRKLSDGEQLYLLLTPTGTPVWRLNYSLGGRQRTLALGVFPRVTLHDAREERARAKDLIRQGIDPVLERRLARDQVIESDSITFEVVAREWLKRRAGRKRWSDVHREKTVQAFERDILPALGKYPIARIAPSMVVDAIDKVVQRGAVETATKELQNIVRVFALAKVKRFIDVNPAADLAEHILPVQLDDEHHPALLTFDELGQVLRDFEHAPFSPQIRMLNRLLAFTVVRHANGLQATWSQFDLDADVPTWVIPRPAMKTKKKGRDGSRLPKGKDDFRLPLSPTIAAELRAWRRGSGKGFLFPSPARKGKPLTLDALSKAFRSLGYAGRHTPHGWRSSFSTLAKESGLFDEAAVEHSLDHVYGTKVQRAYDRGKRWDERVKLMRWWDAQLVAAQHGTTPLSIARSA